MSEATNHQDAEKQFADELAKELEARERNQTLEKSDSQNANEKNLERIRKVTPVLDLLVEFGGQPEILATHSEVDTGERKFEVTLKSSSNTSVPNLELLGRFQIQREIGRGGNGIVFQALDLQLDRVVALKIPRLSVALAGETKIRFEREAKAAASLNHEGIVSVYEVGHEQGLDYIVCQFVEGTSLAHWLQLHAISDRQSAACVAFLAETMHHAHERGVLHRDLKPSNVIVEESDLDIASRLRIVDFGLAAIKTDVSDALTATGSMIGTPAYMSPEQTRSSTNITAATDVYGLGAILYQLLTGQAPFQGDDFIEIIENVRRLEPVSPTQLKSQIPRDLAAIVMKCLEKRPADRYLTAGDLRADLERFLNNEIVTARSSSIAVRAKKWVQRNTLVTTLIVTLLGGVIATSYAAIQASKAENRSRLSEEKTKIEAENVIAVSDYLEEMFQIPSVLARGKNKLRGKDVTAEEILDYAAKKIQDDLDSRPHVKARLMTIIGVSLSSIGKYEKAEKLLRSGLRLNLDNPDSSDLQLAKSHFELGQLLRRLDKFDEAKMQTQTAIDILEKDIKSNAKLLANCYNSLGLLLRPKAPDAAREAYCTARDLVETYQPEEKENWTLSANIATLDYLSGHYDLAAESYERALNLATASLGESHPKVAILLGNLSRVYMRLGKFEKARQMRLRDMEIIRQEFGPEHAEYGISLVGYANILQKLGEWDAALESGKQGVQILQSALPKHHRQTTASINNYVVSLIRTSQFDKALQYTKDIEEADDHRLEGEPDFQMLKNQLLISQVERMSGNLASAQKRIQFVLNHELTQDNKSIGTNARFAMAFYLAETSDEAADTTMTDAIQYAKTSKTLAEPDILYTEAVYWALAKKPEQAIIKLKQAADSGLKDSRILGDPDLRSLESSKPFQEIQSEVRERLSGS